MSARAEALARRFAAVNAAFVDFIAAIPAVQWGQTVGDGELRTVGLVAQHVAFSYTWLPHRYGAIAAGQPLPPLSPDEANAVNAQVAAEAEGMTQAAVVAALRTAGATATEWIRGLSDEQLDRTGLYLAAYPAHTVEDWIKGGFLGHPPAHLHDIRRVLEREEHRNANRTARTGSEALPTVVAPDGESTEQVSSATTGLTANMC